MKRGNLFVAFIGNTWLTHYILFLHPGVFLSRPTMSTAPEFHGKNRGRCSLPSDFWGSSTPRFSGIGTRVAVLRRVLNVRPYMIQTRLVTVRSYSGLVTRKDLLQKLVISKMSIQKKSREDSPIFDLSHRTFRLVSNLPRLRFFPRLCGKMVGNHSFTVHFGSLLWLPVGTCETAWIYVWPIHCWSR